MARAPLSGVFIQSRLRERINTRGTCYVYNPGTTTEASVFINSSAATTITQPLTFNVARDALPGWVEAGEYDLHSGGKTQPVEVHAGDANSAVPTSDHHEPAQSLSVSTIPGGIYGCNSDLVTLTDGTVIFAKLPPIYRSLAATKFFTHVGQTESATETDQRLGLYTSDGTTMTRVALSAASTTLLETDDIEVKVDVTTNGTDAATYTLVPGVEYWMAILSDATTAGTTIGRTLVGIGAATAAPTSAVSPVVAYTLAGQTALDATEAISGLTASWVGIPYMGVSVA